MLPTLSCLTQYDPALLKQRLSTSRLPSLSFLAWLTTVTPTYFQSLRAQLQLDIAFTTFDVYERCEYVLGVLACNPQRAWRCAIGMAASEALSERHPTAYERFLPLTPHLFPKP